MESMIENDVMKAAMKSRGMTQMQLAKRMGTAQTSLSNSMNRTRTSVQVLKDILNELEYDLVVMDRKTGEVKWRIDV